MPMDFTINNIRCYFDSLRFSAFYLVEAFISQCGYLLNGRIDEKFEKMIRSLDDAKLERVLSKLSSNLISNRFIDFYEELKLLIERKFVAPLEITIPNVELMRRATITPSRIIFHFAEPSFSNRVTRQFGSEHFLRLKFCDEDMRKLNTARNYVDTTLVYERIRRLLNDGIRMQNRQYAFLAMSSSQMREHGCWLFCELNNTNAQNVRNWLGDFSSIRCIGKYAARLGQSLSSSVGTFQSNNVIMIDDIENEAYCFTDGIGKISKKKAIEISRTHFKVDYASAFQIRYGGYKGVVAVDMNLTNYELVFRKSMKKFDSGYNRLDVLNVAKHVDCYLNRQVIIILSSLGIPDSVFIDLQDIMLNELSSMFTDRYIASKYIQAYFRGTFSFSHNNPALNYAFEPFFRSLLKIIYFKTMEDLIKKSRIYVKVNILDYYNLF
jgi:RNA-dependent RNA polymerase